MQLSYVIGHELVPVLVSNLYVILLQFLNKPVLIKLNKTDKIGLRMWKPILRKVKLNINAKYKVQKTSKIEPFAKTFNGS